MPDDDGLSHLDDRGHARMVDVGGKDVTRRTAVASATLTTRPEVVNAIRAGEVPKGDVAAVARIAGIMAAKQTPQLIPLCHPLPIDSVTVDVEFPADDRVRVVTTVATSSRTGVEMEALTAASVAALAVYDMCKALDKAIVIGPVQLERKTGGKSGDFVRDDA